MSEINGIICINKPRGFTSFDVVAKARGILGTKKIGHSGTLDPMAEGVLPLYIGNATRAVDCSPSDDKEYRAGFRLGITTDTEDFTGKTLTESGKGADMAALLQAAKSLTGEIMQTPPMYSAVSVCGVRLYDLARQGITIERQPRKITVYGIEIEQFDGQSGVMRVSCGKGTYIRTLIADIGALLGTGAIMTALTRTKSGVFTLDDCHTLDELSERKAAGEDLSLLALPLSRLFSGMERAILDEEQTKRWNNGADLDFDRVEKTGGIKPSERYAVYDAFGTLRGLAARGEDNCLTALKRFALEK